MLGVSCEFHNCILKAVPSGMTQCVPQLMGVFAGCRRAAVGFGNMGESL